MVWVLPLCTKKYNYHPFITDVYISEISKAKYEYTEDRWRGILKNIIIIHLLLVFI